MTSQLFVDIADNCGRDRKAEALITAVLAEQEGIDSYQFTFDAQQRAATVSGINGCIGLDIKHRIIRMRLPADGADDSDRHRIVETLGAADSQHNLPLTGTPRVLVESDGRQPGGFYLQERNVGFSICSHHHGIQHFPSSQRFAIRANHHGIQCWLFSYRHRSIACVVRFRRQHHADATRIPYHMLIGDDVSRGIHDDS